MRKLLFLTLLVLVAGCVSWDDAGNKTTEECVGDDCDELELDKFVFKVDAPDPSCVDGRLNQGELGVDCGGPCRPCKGRPTCRDRIQNQGELGVDCGGPCPECSVIDTCKNGVLDPDEVEVDCGGNCTACPEKTCSDGIFNQDEIDVDCGGVCPDCHCKQKALYLTDISQDGGIGDSSNPLDGTGEKLSVNGYNMVGDLPEHAGASNDDTYRVVIAVPLTSLSGNLSDVKLNVLPYISQGNIADIHVGHINCSGKVTKEDYGSPLNEYAGVLVKKDGVDEKIYGIDVTDFVQKDMDAGFSHSCYRLYWEDSHLKKVDNGIADRRIMYGYGSKHPPYVTYFQRPCIRCATNADCGLTDYIFNHQCKDMKLIRQYVHNRCAAPDTLGSACIGTQDFDIADECDSDEACIDGEDTCFLKECYNNEHDNTSERDVDCGGSCRPCHCFNNRLDENEVGMNCGGSCKPCPIDNKLPVIRIVSPYRGATYNSTRVWLRYLLNKDQLTCTFQLNNGQVQPLNGDRFVNVARGGNALKISCEDPNGLSGYTVVGFKVDPRKSMICQEDPMNTEYSTYFDKVSLFKDNSSQFGFNAKCMTTEFLNATTRRDSFKHFIGPLHLDQLLADKRFNEQDNAVLGYACDIGGRHEASYLHVSSGASLTNESLMSAVIYYQELSEVASQNSHWRIYLYDPDKDAVNASNYIDIPYEPMNSSCILNMDIKYQELDFKPFFPYNSSITLDGIDARIAIYSRTTAASIQLMEAELSLA
ncbi:hypothetical protein ACFLRF_00570 [Candidatus Altiarchaeota archaeon]